MDRINATDAQLVGHPYHAFYWPLIAAYVYSFASGFFMAMLTPDLLALFAEEGAGANREKWIYGCMLQGLILIRMSLWAEKTNGEPFGAPVRSDLKWFVFAVIMVPILHYLTFELIGSLVSSGESDWTVRDDFDASMFEAERYGLMLLYVIVLAPIVEEVGFRGILLGYLRGRGIPEALGVLISAAGFALLHTQYTTPALIAIFVLGLILGWLRLASKSIGPPIIAHMAVNTLVSFY